MFQVCKSNMTFEDAEQLIAVAERVAIHYVCLAVRMQW